MLQISLNKDYHIKNVAGFISPSLVFQSGEINNLYNIYIIIILYVTVLIEPLLLLISVKTLEQLLNRPPPR